MVSKKANPCPLPSWEVIPVLKMETCFDLIDKPQYTVGGTVTLLRKEMGGTTVTSDARTTRHH